MAVSAEDFQDLIERLGPADADVLAIVQRDDRNWVVRYEALDVEFERDPAGGVSLQADVGIVPPQDRAEVYATLLKYNLLRRDTGGITLGAKPDDMLVQMLDLTDDMLTDRALPVVVANFVAKARAWRSLVAAGRPADFPVESAPVLFRV